MTVDLGRAKPRIPKAGRDTLRKGGVHKDKKGGYTRKQKHKNGGGTDA